MSGTILKFFDLDLQFKKSCATINIVFKQQIDEGDSVLVELTGRKHRRLRVHLKEAEQ